MSTAEKNNEKLFPLFRRNLTENNVNLYAATADKLASWASRDRAYYPYARPMVSLPNWYLVNSALTSLVLADRRAIGGAFVIPVHSRSTRSRVRLLCGMDFCATMIGNLPLANQSKTTGDSRRTHCQWHYAIQPFSCHHLTVDCALAFPSTFLSREWTETKHEFRRLRMRKCFATVAPPTNHST